MQHSWEAAGYSSMLRPVLMGQDSISRRQDPKGQKPERRGRSSSRSWSEPRGRRSAACRSGLRHILRILPPHLCHGRWEMSSEPMHSQGTCSLFLGTVSPHGPVRYLLFVADMSKADRLKLLACFQVSGDVNSFSLQWFLIEYPFEVMIAII